MPTLQALFDAVDGAQEEIINLLCELIRIPTVNTGRMPTGDERPLCEFLQAKLEKDGIASQIYPSAENRANLVARLTRRGDGPRLLYMGHIDVVPVEDAPDWRYPPFGGTVAEGRVWGRGAADMKDLVTAETMAMIILARAGVELEGDLILAAGADEEAGGKYGFGWLAEHAPDAIAADYAINEGGGMPIKIGDRVTYPIPTGEKGRLEVHIALQGRGGHAARPWLSDNVSYKLAEVLERIEGYRPEIDVSHEAFGELDALLGLEEPITAANVDALADRVAEWDPNLAAALRAMSRMTLTPTMFEGGVKSNSVPSAATLVCDVRTLPHQDEAYVRRQVEQILEGIPGASYELVYTAVPSASPYDTPFAAALRRAAETASGRGDLGWVPWLTVGFTDSRLVRPLGPVIYGFGMEHPDVDTAAPRGVHGRNEFTDIRSLILKTKMLVALAIEVLGKQG